MTHISNRSPLPSLPEADLTTIEHRIRDAEDEVQRLRAVPVPPPDIKERVREYVATLARPKVSGIGQQLRVIWPNDTAAVLALLLPEQMTSALLQEIERANRTCRYRCHASGASPSCRPRSTRCSGKPWRSAPAPADCRPRSCWGLGSLAVSR
jgi:hypothetical protein